MDKISRRPIISLLIIIVLITGMVSLWGQRGSDLLDEDETLDRDRSDHNGRRVPSYFRFGRFRSNYYNIFWFIGSILVGLYWRNKGRSFWLGVTLSYFLSPVIGFIIGYFLKGWTANEVREQNMEAFIEAEVKEIAKKKAADESLAKAASMNNIEMIPITGGYFQITNHKADTDAEKEKVIPLANFYISKYPVTQKLWRMIMGYNPSEFSGDNLPVDSVSWYQAIEFCNNLSSLHGLEKVYNVEQESNNGLPGLGISNFSVTVNEYANGYRLPTEAEWEYAARGGYEDKGFMYAGSDRLDDVAWYNGNSGGKPHTVGEKMANELGIYDMSGNVWEWCWDEYEELNDSSGKEEDRKKRVKGKIIRGGSWDYGPVRCRVDHRFFRVPNSRDNDSGFRVVHKHYPSL